MLKPIAIRLFNCIANKMQTIQIKNSYSLPSLLLCIATLAKHQKESNKDFYLAVKEHLADCYISDEATQEIVPVLEIVYTEYKSDSINLFTVAIFRWVDCYTHSIVSGNLYEYLHSHNLVEENSFTEKELNDLFTYAGNHVIAYETYPVPPTQIPLSIEGGSQPTLEQVEGKENQSLPAENVEEAKKE